MAIKFTPAYVENIVSAHLEPGEKIVARAAGVHRPIWTLGIRFFWKTYLIVATDRRLVLVEHRRGLLYDRVERVEAIAWADIDTAKVSGLMRKSLKLAFKSGRSSLSLRLPGLFGPMARNNEGAKSVVSTWEQRKALPSAHRPALGFGGAQPVYQ
jgi:hypothetical protein